jgi:hypothetical protein
MTNDIYIGDTGVQIVYLIKGLAPADLAAIDVSKFEIYSPITNTQNIVTAGVTGANLVYITLVTDLAESGTYRVVPYIETSTGIKKHLDAFTFLVLDPKTATT